MEPAPNGPGPSIPVTEYGYGEAYQNRLRAVPDPISANFNIKKIWKVLLTVLQGRQLSFRSLPEYRIVTYVRSININCIDPHIPPRYVRKGFPADGESPWPSWRENTCSRSLNALPRRSGRTENHGIGPCPLQDSEGWAAKDSFPGLILMVRVTYVEGYGTVMLRILDLEGSVYRHVRFGAKSF